MTGYNNMMMNMMSMDMGMQMPMSMFRVQNHMKNPVHKEGSCQ